MSDTVSQQAPVPTISLALFTATIGDPTRWRILQTLRDGLPRMVIEIADNAGMNPATVSKALVVMKRAGLVVKGQAGMYRIPAHFFPEPGKPHIDVGYAILRLDVSEPS